MDQPTASASVEIEAPASLVFEIVSDARASPSGGGGGALPGIGGLFFGALEMDFADGQIRFRTSISVEGTEPASAIEDVEV